MKLLIYPAVEPERLSRIIRDGAPISIVNAGNEQDALREIADADAFFGKITPRLLAAARTLVWVQAPTVSLEHYVFPELVDHPCVLTNMRGLFSDVIAEQVIGYLICFSRNLHRYIRQQIEHRWEPIGGEGARVTMAMGPGVQGPIDLAHRQLAGATLGVVGLGQIGGEIARRGAAFGMHVVAVDPRSQGLPGVVETCWPPGELDRLLAASDYVVVAAPHTPKTEQMFRRPQFQAMRPGAYFINIGRGAIVSLNDLVAALHAGEIAGAALDVFEVEPLPAEHPLWNFENVILTPHVAGYAPAIAERHLALLLENIRRFAQGQPLANVADKAAWF